MYKLRKATKEDYHFLRQLNEITMKDYIIETYGAWEDEVEEKYFNESVESFAYQIIVIDGVDAGCLAVAQTEKEIFISEIQLLPEYQHQGIGRRIFASLISDSQILQLPLNLEVLKVNQLARDFYQKIGFVKVGGTKTHYLMRRKPTV